MKLLHIAISEDWHQAIPKSEIVAALNSDDLEIGGTAYEILSSIKTARWIDPPPSIDESQSLTMDYLRRCIEQNPVGEWCYTRYEAAREAQRWVLERWDNENRSSSYFEKWKEWIKRLYLAGNDEIRRALVDGILEHLFEKTEIRQNFADWREDPQLQIAYDEAQLWADTQS